MDIECLYSETVPCPNGPIYLQFGRENLYQLQGKTWNHWDFFKIAIELGNNELKNQGITKGTMFISLFNGIYQITIFVSEDDFIYYFLNVFLF